MLFKQVHGFALQLSLSLLLSSAMHAFHCAAKQTLDYFSICHRKWHDLDCGGAVPQQTPAMSEQAAAAIDADMQSDKASGSKAQQRKVTDSAKGDTNGYHHMNGKADGEKTVDASQVAEKVWVCLSFCDR